MAKPLERYENFRYMPTRIKDTLNTTLAKKPIDILSPKTIGTHFVNSAEAEDVLDFISQFTHPIHMGLYGSRANGDRPPLFQNVAELNSYYNKKGKDFYSFEDYELAKEYLKKGFNSGYLQGAQYPESVVSVLVSDIDLFIITEGKHLGGPRTGRKTHVILDVLQLPPDFGLRFGSEYLDDLQESLAQTVPLKYN